MTRIEVSIHGVAIEKYDVSKPSFKTVWHKRVAKAIDCLTANFLNDEDNLEHYYRKIQIPKLLSLLMRTAVNFLAIGRKECWIINARTPHKRHFVGTQCSVSVFERPTEL